MARKQKQKAKPKAVKDGKKPVARPRRSGASATSTAHDASSAPKTTATENKKSTTMTGGISKRTSRRMPARTGKKDPWSEEQLTTSSKSRLIDIDLVQLLANPNSWNCLEEEEKTELLSLLPSHVHPNPGPDPDNPDHKIEPLPQSFLRYSNNWRDAVRGFQFDLESGRYDPEWQAQAALAMEERVSGKFDQFKEDQYEEFWGQKQKLRYDVETGDSNQVKLETLVKNKVIRVGDVWKYSRLFVKDGRILIEKEVKILSVDENYALTFAIPGGHRVFLKQDYAKSESPGAQTAPGSSNGSESNAEVNSKPEAESKQAEVKPEPETESVAAPENGSATKVEVEAEASVEVKRDSESSNSSDPSNLPATDGDPALKGDTPMPSAPPAEEDNNPTGQSSLSNADDEPALKEDTPMPTAPPTAEDTTAQDTVPQNTTSDKTTVENNTAGGPTSDVPISENSTPGESMSNSPVPNDATKSDADVILPGVYQPNTLGVKILKIDGRITKPSHGNAWKDFRCIRNNQDMGSLWEVRQAWSMKGK